MTWFNLLLALPQITSGYILGNIEAASVTSDWFPFPSLRTANETIILPGPKKPEKLFQQISPFGEVFIEV